MKWPWQRQIGWKDIGEDFIRYTLLHAPFFTVYLHRLNAPNPHPECHDHPWNFLAVVLLGGYNEYHNGVWIWRGPGSILFRPATFRHNVVTRGVSWSVILTGKKFRGWGFTSTCGEPVRPHVSF